MPADSGPNSVRPGCTDGEPTSFLLGFTEGGTALRDLLQNSPGFTNSIRNCFTAEQAYIMQNFKSAPQTFSHTTASTQCIKVSLAGDVPSVTHTVAVTSGCYRGKSH